jgi:polyphosphate:AMP phosphotransferase
MFETAEVGSKVDKATYGEEAPKIREALLGAQRELANSDLSVIIFIGGVEGAGKTETVNFLLEWMDARGIETHALSEPTDEERERPHMWRFWRLLPPKQRIGIFLGSWYTSPIIDRVFERIDDGQYERLLDRIVNFERMLTLEGTLVIKFWLHLSKAVQKARLKKLESSPKTAWRVTKRDWKFFKRYDDFRRVSEMALRKTGIGRAPWHIVEGTDPRHRTLTVTRTILKSLRERLDAERAAPQRSRQRPPLPKPAKRNIINQLDPTLFLDRNEYDKKLLRYQRRLALLTRRLYDEKRSLILVFEGPDAAGKGGAIRRLTGCMDARTYQVISIAAPTDEERAHPYLWRFWRPLPRLGRVTIYDRSWYGRVLVERVEGFAAPADWKRAYAEINAMEEQLAESGIVLIKFWLAIGPDEQLSRFKSRQITPYKQYKITEEDWRNREKWDAYEAAACDMIEKTSTSCAPWVPVEGNDKLWTRVKVIQTVCDHLKAALGG